MCCVCSALVRFKCVLLIQGQSIVEAAKHWTATATATLAMAPRTRPRPTTNVMTSGRVATAAATPQIAKRLTGFVPVCVSVPAVLPVLPVLPVVLRHKHAPVPHLNPAGIGAKVKVPQLKRIKTNFTLFALSTRSFFFWPIDVFVFHRVSV